MSYATSSATEFTQSKCGSVFGQGTKPKVASTDKWASEKTIHHNIIMNIWYIYQIWI